MINTVLKYKEYTNELPDLISKSDYKTQYFLRILGMPQATYYRKLRENAFSVDEIETITNALYPEEALLSALEKSQKDREEGRTIPHEEVMKSLRKEFL